jgi:NADPH:quinone reductase-like Zn-dependent oxidoreductase
VGVFWGEFSKREPKANAAMMMELAQWYGQGKIKPVIPHHAHDRTARRLCPHGLAQRASWYW